MKQSIFDSFTFAYLLAMALAVATGLTEDAFEANFQRLSIIFAVLILLSFHPKRDLFFDTAIWTRARPDADSSTQSGSI